MFKQQSISLKKSSQFLLILGSIIATNIYTVDQASKRPLTLYEAAFCGTVAGCAELVTGNPLNNTKIRYQQGLSLTLNPRILYKNGVLTALCMGPTTMVQGACNEQFKAMAGGPCWQAAAAGGLISGLLANPTDAIAQYRLTMNTPIPQAIKKAPLARGLAATMPREAIWASGLFYFRKELLKLIDDTPAAQILAGTIVGAGAAVASHPFDTIAMMLRQSIIQKGMPFGILSQQKEILPLMRHELDTLRYILKNKGIRGFYPGITARTARASIAASVIGVLYDSLAESIR